MKRFWSILLVTILVLTFTQDANASWRGRCYHGGWGGYYRPAPVPAPYYRPYYPAPAPMFRDRWVQPHYRRTPYGDQFVPGHWARVRVY